MRDQVAGDFPGSVLIADDHAVLRTGLVQLLGTSLKVRKFLEAETFAEAIDRLSEPDVTLAIIDLGMPGVETPRDIAQLRMLRPEARLVVLSGSSSRQDILDALAAGAHGYIVKTITNEQLLARLRYILSGEIYVPASLANMSAACAEFRRTEGSVTIGNKSLSDRQLQVLRAVIDGKSNREIAQHLNVAEGTVKMHLAALFRTLGATNRTQAAALGKKFIG